MTDKELLKHIQLGTGEVFYYNYNGEPLPLRPISSLELDDCFYKALSGAPKKIAELVIKLRTHAIKPTEDINVSNDGLKKLQRLYDSIDYWMVYHAMKDFQDDDFTKPNYDTIEQYQRGYYLVRKMQDIHQIARRISNASNQPKDVVKEILKTTGGKEIASIFYYLKQPLVEKIGKATRLQKKFMIYSKGELKKLEKDVEIERRYSISGKEMSLGEFLEGMR